MRTEPANFDAAWDLTLPGEQPVGRTGPRGPFVLGPENRLLAAVLAELAAVGEKTPAPWPVLVLAGPCGTGKTRLLQSWTRTQGAVNAESAAYFTAADFARDFRAAIVEGDRAAWRRRTDALQLLALDDLHGFRPGSPAQAELCRVSDGLARRGGLLAVGTRVAPGAWSGLSPTLADRLTGGLTVALHLPGEAARRRLLEADAAAQGFTITEQQLRRLVHDTQRCDAAAVVARLARLEIDAEEAAASSGADRALRRQRDVARWKQILAATARYFGITQKALAGPSRRASVVRARNLAAYLGRRLTKLSYADIGRGLGGRDHTTILHAERRLDEMRSVDRPLQQALDDLQRLLQ